MTGAELAEKAVAVVTASKAGDQGTAGDLLDELLDSSNCKDVALTFVGIAVALSSMTDTDNSILQELAKWIAEDQP